MDPTKIAELKAFVALIKGKPDLLHTPELKFFKDWLISLGAKFPDHDNKSKAKDSPKPQNVEELSSSSESESEIVESELDLSDVETVEEPDIDLPSGDVSIEVTEEMQDEADTKRSEAQEKMSNGELEAALSLFNEAIIKNPSSALLHARRANCLLKLKRPKAAIADCKKAITINPDSAGPYKIRGLSNKALGNWVEAYTDLQLALKLDYSDDAYEASKSVEPKYKRIHEHQLKYTRLREEKERNARLKRVRKAKKEAAKRAQEEANGDSADDGCPSFGGMSGMFNDPELTSAMSDPEVTAAFSDIMKNPSNMSKYMTNPKVMKVMAKMQSKFGGGMGGGMPGGMGGMPGGMPGGMGGLGGMFGGMPGAPPKSSNPPKSDDLD